MSTTDDEVIIVGGGIGGMGAALALARTGLSVRLLERAPEFSEVGAGLQVGPNAVRALDRLGVLPQITELAVFPEYGRISSAVTGEELTRLDLGAPMVERFGYPYLVLHRNDVLTALLDACRRNPLIALENDRQVERVEQLSGSQGERMIIECAGGASYSAKLLVGADGLNSVVRKLLVDDGPSFSGYVAYRGTMPIGALPHRNRTDDVLLWVGPEVHLMQYPVRRGELYNQVAVFRTHWHQDGRADWGSVEELRERFAPMHESVREAVESIADAPAYPNYDKEPLTSFVAGRAVLLGDAAHPMLQYLGQGACQALEDGLALAAVLGGNVDEPHRALAVYDEHRVPRTTRCQSLARPWGASWHSSDPTLIAYRDRFFRERRSDDFSDLAWLYEDALAWTKGMVAA